MIVTPEMAPRELDVPCVYHKTTLNRSAALLYDPYALISFSATAATYAIHSFDTKEHIVEYLESEFKRHYGGQLSVEPHFTFEGDYVSLDIVVKSHLPPGFTAEVQ